MGIKVLTFLFLSILLCCSCSSHRRNTESNKNKSTITVSSSKGKKNTSSNKNTKTLKGKASYYADKFQGRKTANGDTFDQKKMTAAHKTLAFGTKVRVKNVSNGKSVDVIINDRGPFVAGRIIDLSRAAAEKIDMVRAGVADVEVTILSVP
ncbi:MAG: septal ring lytic transglycosylase RlpA family protein [Marinilabiliaceae bacterium]|nr:septal ring lytic transglycosylase RlpA family protein [Marinilabiliaceae bacterium]